MARDYFSQAFIDALNQTTLASDDKQAIWDNRTDPIAFETLLRSRSGAIAPELEDELRKLSEDPVMKFNRHMGAGQAPSPDQLPGTSATPQQPNGAARSSPPGEFGSGRTSAGISSATYTDPAEYRRAVAQQAQDYAGQMRAASGAGQPPDPGVQKSYEGVEPILPDRFATEPSAWDIPGRGNPITRAGEMFLGTREKPTFARQMIEGANREIQHPEALLDPEYLTDTSDIMQPLVRPSLGQPEGTMGRGATEAIESFTSPGTLATIAGIGGATALGEAAVARYVPMIGAKVAPFIPSMVGGGFAALFTSEAIDKEQQARVADLAGDTGTANELRGAMWVDALVATGAAAGSLAGALRAKRSLPPPPEGPIDAEFAPAGNEVSTYVRTGPEQRGKATTEPLRAIPSPPGSPASPPINYTARPPVTPEQGPSALLPPPGAGEPGLTRSAMEAQGPYYIPPPPVKPVAGAEPYVKGVKPKTGKAALKKRGLTLEPPPGPVEEPGVWRSPEAEKAWAKAGYPAREKVARETPQLDQGNVIELATREMARPGESRPLALGKPATIKVGPHTSTVSYALVRNKDLVTSHVGEQENPSFPQEAQGRIERGGNVSLMQQADIANRLDYRQVADSYLANTGAPIIRPDMVVLSGNGRTGAMRIAFNKKGIAAEQYQKQLLADLEKKGFNREDAEKILSENDDVMLVRMRNPNADILNDTDFARLANVDDIAEMSPTETAMQDSGRMTTELMEMLDTSMEKNPLLAASNRAFIQRFVNEVVPVTQRNTFMTAGGRLSKRGMERLQASIFARAYGKPEAVGKLVESVTGDKLADGLMRAAPSMLATETAIKRGERFNVPIGEDAAIAAERVDNAEERGANIDDYVSQRNLIEVDFDPVERELISAIGTMRDSPAKLGAFLKNYNLALQRYGNPKQGDMFGEAKPPPKKLDLLKKARSETEMEYAGKSAKAKEPQQSLIPKPPGGGGPMDPEMMPGEGEGAYREPAVNTKGSRPIYTARNPVTGAIATSRSSIKKTHAVVTHNRGTYTSFHRSLEAAEKQLAYMKERAPDTVFSIVEVEEHLPGSALSAEIERPRIGGLKRSDPREWKTLDDVLIQADSRYMKPRASTITGTLYLNEAGAAALRAFGMPRPVEPGDSLRLGMVINKTGTESGLAVPPDAMRNLAKGLTKAIDKMALSGEAKESATRLAVQLMQAHKDNATVLFVKTESSGIPATMSELKTTGRHEQTHLAQEKFKELAGHIRPVDPVSFLEENGLSSARSVRNLLDVGYHNDADTLVAEIGANLVSGREGWGTLGLSDTEAKAMGLSYIKHLASEIGDAGLDILDFAAPEFKGIIDAYRDNARATGQDVVGELLRQERAGEGEPAAADTGLSERGGSGAEPGMGQSVQLGLFEAVEGIIRAKESTLRYSLKKDGGAGKPPADAGESRNWKVGETPVNKDLLPVLYYLQSPSISFGRVYKALLPVVHRAIAAEQNIAHKTAVRINEVRGYMRSTPREHRYNLITLLDDPNVTPENVESKLAIMTSPGKGKPYSMDSELTRKVTTSYRNLRNYFDRERQEVVDLKIAGGENIDPETYGIRVGYWMHLFDGHWVALRRTGLDPKTNEPIMEPIETDRPGGSFAPTAEEAASILWDHLNRNPDFDPSEYSIGLHKPNFAGDGRVGMSDQEFYRVLKRLRQDANISAEEAWDVANAAIRRGAPRRSAPFTRKRTAELPGYMMNEDALYMHVRQAERWKEMYPLRRLLEASREDLKKAHQSGEVGKNIVAAFSTWVDRVEGRPDRLTESINDWIAKPGKKLYGTNFRIPTGRPNWVERSTGIVKGFESVAKLGLSGGAVVMNLSQTAVNTFPVLGAKYTMLGVRGVLDPRMRKKYAGLIDTLGIKEQTGKMEDVASLSQFLDLYRPETISEAARTAHDVVVKSALYGFQGAESFNRRAAAIGGFERARANGMGVEDAIEVARRVVTRTNFHLGPADQPPLLATSKVLSPAFQFKSFFLKQAEFVFGIHKEDTPGRFDSKRTEMLRFMMTMLGVTGMAGAFAIETMDDLIEMASSLGYGHYGRRPFTELTLEYPRAMRGIPGMVVGADFSQSVGFADWLSPSQQLSWRNVRGPWLTDLQNAVAIASQPSGRLRNGQIERFMRGISPIARKNYEAFFSDVADQFQGGAYVDSKGHIVLQDMTTWERWLYQAGLTPVRMADANLRFREMYRVKIAIDSERNGLSDEIISAHNRGDKDEKARLFKVARELGHDSDPPYGFTKSINNRIKAPKKPRAQRLIEQAPKGFRPYLRERFPPPPQ